MSDEQNDEPVIEPVEGDLTGELIPKKIPAIDDEQGQIKALTGALASALLTATDVPMHALQPFLGDISKQLVAYGIRQTDLINTDAVRAPAWIVDGVRQASMPVPEKPDPHLEQPAVARTAEAPPMPEDIPESALAVQQ